MHMLIDIYIALVRQILTSQGPMGEVKWPRSLRVGMEGMMRV